MAFQTVSVTQKWTKKKSEIKAIILDTGTRNYRKQTLSGQFKFSQPTDKHSEPFTLLVK